MARRLQANVRIAATQIEERGPGYSRSAASSYSKSRSERPRQRRRSQGPLDPVAEEGRGENEVVQPANPAANAAANAPANPAANAPTNTPANVVGNAANNATNAANIQGNAAPNPRHNAGAQPPPVQANRAEGSQRHRIRDEVEITTASMGSLTPLMPTTPFKRQISGSCMTRNSYDVLSTTKTTTLPTTSTSSLLIMLHQQAREQSITFPAFS
jgi:hypothetical protein